MLRDYSLSSPSLDGILSHDSVVYEGLFRPNDIIRVFDKAVKGGPINDLRNPENRKILQEYFHDLYGLFMRKISHCISDANIDADTELKVQAMLQELLKVKRLLRKGEELEIEEKTEEELD